MAGLPETTELRPLEPPQRTPVWKYVRALGPVVLFWAVLVGWLAYLLHARTRWGPETDEANLREWIDETRVHRKTVPEVIREYLRLLDRHQQDPSHSQALQDKGAELADQLSA